jgi:hypothetical protein
MKYFWIAILFFSACAIRSIDEGQTTDAKPQMNSSTSKNLSLLEAYQKTSTGGKEREDGKHTSTSYSIVLFKEAQVSIEAVYLFGEEKSFETVDYEGKFFIIIQVFPEAKEQVRGEMIQSANAADIYYLENGVKKVLGVPKFFLKDAVIGN